MNNQLISLEEKQRTETVCIACNEEKDKGLVVCWNCFKYIDNPYKTSELSFNDWLLTTLTAEQKEELENLVIELEYNPKHEDDYFNAGGFNAHWNMYTAEEQSSLLEKVK